MLQQTQVKTVLPYFKKFTKKFPTLESLSKSNEKQILKMWEGLGYYRRARNLYACSNQLINLYKGKLPKTLDEIKKLPGIGTRRMTFARMPSSSLPPTGPECTSE